MKKIKYEKEKHNETKKFRTNKAVFEISGDKLTKKYFKTGDALNDYLLLKKIQEEFHHQKKGEWNYRALKVYKNPSENVIQMEYFPGEIVRKVFARRRDPRVYHHMGIWLRILHKSTRDSQSDLVLTYRDFADGNFLLDSENKIALGIDPGNFENLMDHPSISVVTGTFSIQRGVLKESKNYLKVWTAQYHYLSGYLIGSEIRLLPRFKKGFLEICRRQKVFWYYKKGMPFSKKVVRTGEIILLATKIILISIVLRAKMYLKSCS